MISKVSKNGKWEMGTGTISHFQVFWEKRTGTFSHFKFRAIVLFDLFNILDSSFSVTSVSFFAYIEQLHFIN